MAQTISIGTPSTTGCPARVPRSNVAISPTSPSQENRPVRTLPSKTTANQSPLAASLTPPMIVLRSITCGRKIVKPRKMNSSASVTMKLGNPVRITMNPFSPPTAIHMIKVTRIASQTGHPSVTEKIAIIMPAKPIIDPTDRSNSPAIIRRHAPTAMIMNCAETIDQFITPWLLNIPLSKANRRNKVKTATVPTIPPSSGRISALRRADISLIRSSVAGFD